MKRTILLLVAFFGFAAPAHAGGPFMLVGTADDVVMTSDPSLTQARMDLLKLAGMETVRVTTFWKPGETAMTAGDAAVLKNVVEAARIDGIRVMVTVMHVGSRTTPLTPEAQQEFASLAADVAKRFPTIRDFIVGNEPNLNRFWLPQFDPVSGADVAAPAYVQLLATTYDAIKLARPFTTVYGGALAPRGIDRPNTGRDTHSPTQFIRDMGIAYRASGRQVPIMDAFTIHPYADNSSQSPDFAHPNSTPIGIADYDKLVALLGEAFDGTAQRGSTLGILYDEFGVETTIPADKAGIYKGNEPATTKPVDDATQAAYYRKAIELTFCQRNVLGFLTFHTVDEDQLPAWQSGLFYADGTPKTSLPLVRNAIAESRRGIIAQCSGLELTPEVVVGYPNAKRLKQRTFKLTLTCPIDCSYVVRLERLPYGNAVGIRSGTAIGRSTTTLTFKPKRPLPRGAYQFSVQAAATVNAGPPFVTTSPPLRVR